MRRNNIKPPRPSKNMSLQNGDRMKTFSMLGIALIITASQAKGLNKEKTALASVYGTIPVITGLVLGMGILFYYEGGSFLSVFVLILFLAGAHRILHRAQTFKNYKEMSTIQKKPLFAAILWEAFCFGAPMFFSKNGNEYVLIVADLTLLTYAVGSTAFGRSGSSEFAFREGGLIRSATASQRHH